MLKVVKKYVYYTKMDFIDNLDLVRIDKILSKAKEIKNTNLRDNSLKGYIFGLIFFGTFNKDNVIF